MPGTRAGALKTAAKLGFEHYSRIGKKGGKKSTHRTFDDPSKARAAIRKRWDEQRLREETKKSLL